MLLIKNGLVLTMEENKQYENGCVICEDDKIIYVGNMPNLADYNITETIDANYGMIIPGLIDAHCHIGMWEDSIGFEGEDGNEDTDPITPQLRAIDGINPFDRAFTDAIKAGVTTVVTGPGSANAIGGQFVAMKTFGNCVDNMILKSPVAMKVALGENPKRTYNDKNQTPVTRMGTVSLIREALIKAKIYKQSLEIFNTSGKLDDKPDFDMKSDALMQVLNKGLLVKVHAHRADDIATAIRIAKEFDLDITIEHATEAHLITDILTDVRLNVGPTLSGRSKVELKHLTFDSYKTLTEAGFNISIITDHPEIPIEQLSLCATMAVKYGMDKTDALCAITINAAKNCKVDDRVGSLVVGKDADIVVFDKMPYEIDAKLKATVINGEIRYLSDI